MVYNLWFLKKILLIFAIDIIALLLLFVNILLVFNVFS